MNITVVGTGHGGCAMAAVLAQHGHDVSMLKLGVTMHSENFAALQRNRAIHLKGIEGEGEFRLKRVTRHPFEAIEDAELILVFYVSNFHPMVANRLAPHLHEGQVVVLNPGYLGTLEFARAMARLGRRERPLFAEFETLPFTSRIGPPGTVTITSRNVRHPFATCPASRADELVEFLRPVLGECVPRTHLIEVALHNPNLVIHTVGVLMNAAAVEHPDRRFAMYRDGFSPAVWNLVGALDNEKMDVLEHLGAPRTPYFDAFRLRTFADQDVDPLEGFGRYAAEAPDGPFTVEHRYVTEDVPMGLGLLHSLGHAAGVPTPMADSMIHVANGLIPHHDFWAEARTLDRLWDGSLEALLKELTS